MGLALGGCMLGPDYQRPAVEIPATYRFAEPEAADVINTDWWNQFQDPVLDELIRSALADNKDIKIAAARVEEYLGRYGETRSQMFPQVGANAQGGQARASREAGPAPLGSGVDRTYKDYQASVFVGWELDVWGRLRRLNEASRAELLATEEGRRTVILTLVTSVADSYVTLRNLDRQLEIARATVQARAESYRIFKLRYDHGIISEMELAQNRSEYEEAQARVPQIESQVAQQENALAVLLGRNPGPIVRGRDLDQLVLPAIPEGLPSELLERRPDLRQAELNLIAANARIGAARALYFPTISLTGLLGTASTHLSNLFTGPAETWSYAAGVAMPIFTAGGIAGQVQQVEAQQQQALFAYQQAIQTAFKDVDDALVATQKTREQLAAQGRQVEALRTYARLARLRYENGYTSYLEVVDSERSLFNAELSYTQTHGAVFSTLISVYKAMGGGWVTNAEQMTAAGVPAAAASN